MRKYRPRILHLNFTGMLSPYPWIARLNGVEQVFFTDQSSQPEGFVPRRVPAWRRGLSRLINYPLNRVVTISESVYMYWTATGLLPEERITRIYNGVDLSAFFRVDGAGVRERFAIPRDRLLAVQAAQVIPEKGFQDLIQTARIVVRANPRAHFLFVGEGPLRAEYTRLTAEMGLADHVTWTGQLTSPMEEGVYAASDVACQMSRWQEGFGWTIAEAMSFHKAVVGTRVGAIPELIEDGTTGFLVERDDHQAAAERILQLFASPELRRSMGAAARRRAEERFDLRANVACLLDLYGIERKPAAVVAAAAS